MTMEVSAAELLVGAWESTEAFGNTSLDWSQALKEKAATLVVTFHRDGAYELQLHANNQASDDVTSQFRHLVPANGTYSVESNQLKIKGDTSGIQWTFQHEEDNTLRIRLQGAKRFGRCKGVDVIYFKRRSKGDSDE
ncbi:hypothetical protein Poli38472_003171 [Pythium oligandrum]|uniref:Lipocalin-like domain-containing protein n=1 Tax=Pythium oligandrum TaxID=41045 RepID=A0A8K1C618_PYTOL|nr:hypothetical protein Poli38472_003171 [Pythium oligandrum]|eukprot:TMW57246.1 hypothetical protein Poli38472_003171 [Pythium oligandrum]